ncbi:V4R domain-containing protein [Thermogladius sp. 4427co]|uniref:V4R domain-containing protein n=1 Tax=Thermogladius sp. 4427co TaxID=3450718 RepID=UPI003F7A8252
MLKRLLGRGPFPGRGPRFELDTVIYAGGKYYTALLLELVNKPGVASRVLNEIAGRGLNIVKVTTPYTVHGDRGHLLILVEDCDEACASRLKNDLGRMKDIVLNIESTSGMDIFLFPQIGDLYLVGEKTLVISSGMLGEAVSELRKGLNPAEARIALRLLGRGAGRYVYRRFASLITLPPDPEQALKLQLEFLKDIARALGIGVLSYELKGLEARIYIEGNTECESAKSFGIIGPAGDYTSGFLEGYLEGVFGRRAVVSEEKCIARGDRRCEFKASFYEPIRE